MRTIVLSVIVGLVLGSLAAPANTSQNLLVINSNASDQAPREAWEAVVQEFRQANPDLDVRLNIYDHESYKRAIRNWLTSAAPDVVFWNAGARMRQFVAPGLLEDVSDLFTPERRREFADATVDLVSVDGRQYGIPYAYYQIGFFYRSDVLQSAGVSQPPQDWEALLAACRSLRANGIVPFAIGTRDLWPAAGWFDYINLRLNGIDFHRRLMNGGIPYTDDKVRAVFAKWRELVDLDCFSDIHASVSWQESQAALYQGKAAMMLIGNFIVAQFPADVRPKIDFYRFPDITDDVGRYEEAPLNSLHIPARAANKDAARRFLAYAMSSEVQETIAAALQMIPANREAGLPEDRFLDAGRSLIAEAEGLTQYFDRDTSEDLAVVAMKGFQEFMVKPERLDEILERIEAARRRIYGP